MTRSTPVAASRWGLLASAIARGDVPVRAVGGDGPAYGDGISIFVAAPDDEWRPIAVQAAMIGAGSFDPAIVRRLVGQRGLAERYGYLEALRAVASSKDRMPSALAREREMVAPLTKTPADSLRLASGNWPLPAAPSWFGTIRPLAILRSALAQGGLSALSSRQQAGEIRVAAVPEHGDDEDGEESRILKLFQSPLRIRNPIATMLGEIMGAGIARLAATPMSQTGEELPVGGVVQALRRGIHAVAAPFLPPATANLAKIDEGAVFPEWDTHRASYRSRWVSVQEAEPWPGETGQGLIGTLRCRSVAMQRQLASLGLSHEWHGGERDGADLDTDAMIACAIDQRTGRVSADADIYRNHRRTRRELAVAVLVDISGSTGEADRSGRTVFHSHMALGSRLGHAFDALGATVAFYGFHSWGRESVRMVRLKGFRESWGAQVERRAGMIAPIGYTRMGAAIRFGADLLTNRIGMPNRLLVLISDGIAYDQDYEGTYAQADTRRALAEARASGTACVCICAGSRSNISQLRAVFEPAQLLAIDDIDQATQRIRATCRAALDQVSGCGSLSARAGHRFR